MPGNEQTRFTCPSCRKTYRWSWSLSGKRVRCKGCGIKMTVPMEAGAMAEPVEPLRPQGGGAYELAVTEEEQQEQAIPRAAPGAKCPACNLALKEGAVLCLNCGFNLAEGRRIQTIVQATPAEATADAPARPSGPATTFAAAIVRKGVDAEALAQDIERQHRRTEVYWPLGLSVAGVVLILLSRVVLAPAAGMDAVLAFIAGSGWLTAAASHLVYAFLRFLVQVPLLFIAILITAQLLGSSFGSVGTALLKMAALVLAVAGVVDLVDVGYFALTGGFVTWIWIAVRMGISMTLFAGLAMKLFDVEYVEGFVMWIIVFFVPWAVLLVLAAIL